MTANITNGIIGARLTDTSDTARFKVGTQATATDGSQWVYVKATTALTIYDCCVIDEDFNAAPITKALLDTGLRVGFAQVAFTINYYGWVALSGSNILCRLAGLCAPDVALYTSATAGVLDDSSTSQTKVKGVVAITTAATATTNIEVMASWPLADI